jgi:large subunit ribosomal protein L9
MELILMEDIKKLGKQGDIVNVKDGYGRNFLIPQNKAVAATVQTRKMVEKLKAKRELAEKKKLGQAEELKAKLEALSITITSEAGEEDKLFGAVTADMIKDAISLESIEVDKRKIVIAEPIKKLGAYEVQIKVYPEVAAVMRIWVVKK